MKSYSIAANGGLVASAFRELDKTTLNLFKQGRRQWPVISALAVNRANVGPWPDEAIAFGQHDPRPFVIETQAALGGRRDFDCFARIRRWRMRDRQDTHCRCSVVKRRNNGQHQSGAVLVTLFPSVQMLPMPRSRIAKDPADLGFNQQHSCPSAVRH